MKILSFNLIQLFRNQKLFIYLDWENTHELIDHFTFTQIFVFILHIKMLRIDFFFKFSFTKTLNCDKQPANNSDNKKNQVIIY